MELSLGPPKVKDDNTLDAPEVKDDHVKKRLQ